MRETCDEQAAGEGVDAAEVASVEEALAIKRCLVRLRVAIVAFRHLQYVCMMP